MYKKIVKSGSFLTFLSVLLFSGVFSSSLYAAVSPQNKEMTFADVAMGGVVHLKMAGAAKEQAGAAAEAAFSTIRLLAADFDHRGIDGSVSSINRAAGERAVVVSADAFTLIKRALDFAAKSDGVFDISIGAVTTAPFYYREKSSVDKSLVDYRQVVLDAAKQTVFLPKKGMALDLGGLAKGTIIDAAAEKIRLAGVPAALVEASGDFFCYGEKVWRVGVQDPRSSGLLGVIEVENAGVCGSGDYYQYAEAAEENGEREHHILDAANLTSAHKSIAVTAIAPNAEMADALATTLFIMGPAKGLVFLEKLSGCSALWVLPDRQLVASPGFPPLLTP